MALQFPVTDNEVRVVTFHSCRTVVDVLPEGVSNAESRALIVTDSIVNRVRMPQGPVDGYIASMKGKGIL